MLERVTKELWSDLVLEWEEECSKYEEDFGDYATASLPVLTALVNETPRRDAGVFALREAGKFEAVCQANSTFLPGYTGKVLRIRHIVLSPRYDFADDIDLEDYGSTLTGVFAGAVGVAYHSMPSEHVKFHLKSPAERSFGSAFTDALQGHESFTDVSIRGSWVYLTKA